MANIEQNLLQTKKTSENTFVLFSFPVRVLERNIQLMSLCILYIVSKQLC